MICCGHPCKLDACWVAHAEDSAKRAPRASMDPDASSPGQLPSATMSELGTNLSKYMCSMSPCLHAGSHLHVHASSRKMCLGPQFCQHLTMKVRKACCHRHELSESVVYTFEYNGTAHPACFCTSTWSSSDKSPALFLTENSLNYQLLHLHKIQFIVPLTRTQTLF